MEKRIITAAITGAIHTPRMSPHLPVTVDQIADEAVRAYEAGAAVAHIHVRNQETGQPSSDINFFKEITAKIRDKCNIIVCITTGGSLTMPLEERLKVIPTLKPELASLNSGSINFALHPLLKKYKDFNFEWEQKYLAGTEDLIFPNTFKSLKEFSKAFEENNVQPELEIYDTGMINNVAFMLANGQIKPPIYIQFVMGILGGIPAKADNLLFLRNTAREAFGDFIWSVCAAGHSQFEMCTLSLLLGGNARVGLEDNLYLERKVLAKSNGEQVEKIVRIARELGIEPATPDEARQILSLKGLDNVGY